MTESKVKRLRIRELLPQYGDLVTTMTVEESKEIDFQKMITVLPNGKVITSWDQLLEEIQSIDVEELEVIRFAPLAGG